MNYFISDLHLGHENVLYFDGRPFSNIEDHDNFIISNWNNVVNIDDDVYILGDISFHNSTKTIEIFQRLNGNKHLILGNHDKPFLKNQNLRDLFVEICDYKELYIEPKLSVVLSHYPIPCFKNMYRGWIHLYGHVHCSFEWNMMKHNKMLLKELYSKEQDMNQEDVCRMFNVGCMIDYMKYTPQPLEYIIQQEG